MSQQLRGLVPILATPFTANGELDLPSLRRLTEFQLTSGVSGTAVFGMASEGFALTAQERRRILATVVEVVSGAVPVVAGVNATSTVTALEQAREAADGGATTLMVLPPFMVRPSPAQLVDFFGEVAAATDAEVMVQDAPGVTGVAMPVPLVAQISALSGVTSVKVEAPPTALKVSGLRAALPDGVAVFGGQNAQFVLDEYARGAVGTMPACEFPDLLGPVLTAWENGEQAKARAEFTRLLPLIVFGLQPGAAWAVHKEVLVRRGLIATACVRRPASDLDDQARASLDTILDDLELGAGR